MIPYGTQIKREDLENFIYEHMKLIKEAYLAYYPDGHYLNMYFDASNGYYHVNNSYYDRDLRKPIDASWLGDEKLTPSERGGSNGGENVSETGSEA